MLTNVISTAVLSEMGRALMLLACVAAGDALVRLILCALAAQATRRALGPSDATTEGDRLRAHRLAVLRALLDVLQRHHRPAAGRDGADEIDSPGPHSE